MGKNDEFSFSSKLMSKLVCLANVVILNSIFSFKNSNTVIKNYGFEFDSIVTVYFIFKFLQLLLSWITIF